MCLYMSTSNLERIEYIRYAYSSRIPIMVNVKSQVLSIDKKRFLVPRGITLHQLIMVIRDYLSDPTDTTIRFQLEHAKSINPETCEDKIEDLDESYCDPNAGMLVINVFRQTTYKWLLSLLYGLYNL